VPVDRAGLVWFLFRRRVAYAERFMQCLGSDGQSRQSKSLVATPVVTTNGSSSLKRGAFRSQSTNSVGEVSGSVEAALRVAVVVR
jgi:hypothetical protein